MASSHVIAEGTRYSGSRRRRCRRTSAAGRRSGHEEVMKASSEVPGVPSIVTAASRDSGHLEQRRLDLLEVHAEATHLDLRVSASLEDEHVVPEASHPIARSVLAPCAPFEIEERCRGGRFVAPVAGGDVRAADDQLAGDARRRIVTVFVDDVHGDAVERQPDRNRDARQLGRVVGDELRADRRLGRSVAVHEHARRGDHLGEVREVLTEHRLAAEDDGTQARERRSAGELGGQAPEQGWRAVDDGGPATTDALDDTLEADRGASIGRSAAPLESAAKMSMTDASKP